MGLIRSVLCAGCFGKNEGDDYRQNGPYLVRLFLDISKIAMMCRSAKLLDDPHGALASDENRARGMHPMAIEPI
jgi:hypothetical protein